MTIEPRGEIRSTRVTAAEADLIDKAARTAGMSPSTFLRHAALRLAMAGPKAYWGSAGAAATVATPHVNIIWEQPA